MTSGYGSHGEQRSPSLSPVMPNPPDVSIRIPKNKSTGNLLLSPQPDSARDGVRMRFSFDAGSTSEMNSLKRAARQDHDLGLTVSGLRRIRRPGGPLRTPTLLLENDEFVPPPLVHSSTLPISTSSSRSVSIGYPLSGPTSPIPEDVHRFPSESLHSFSFAKQSEDSLHSRQNILKKTMDFMRDRSAFGTNPALAEAQARASGNAEVQSMMELLKKANVLQSDSGSGKIKGLGLGPVTGPAHADARNVFEKSFIEEMQPEEEAILSPTLESVDPSRRPSMIVNTVSGSPHLTPQIRRPSSSSGFHPPPRNNMRRTYTDITSLSLQQKLIEALAQPYSSDDPPAFGPAGTGPQSASESHPELATTGGAAVHSHSSKWAPTAQAVFRTEADAPWTILAANDLACLIFGVTRAEVRSLSILGIIQEDRRGWLEEKLGRPAAFLPEEPKSPPPASNGKSPMIGGRDSITARLLSKAPSRVSKPSKRAQTDDGSGGYYRQTPKNHPPTKSRGVLLCGDIVPIQKRNGTTGSASFWVMEKKGGLIWVIEEVTEDVVTLAIDTQQRVIVASGEAKTIWGYTPEPGTPVRHLLPQLTMESSLLESNGLQGKPHIGHTTVRTAGGANVPATVSKAPGRDELRVSCLPHIAGMMVVNTDSLTISSSNAVFAAALFGYEQPKGLSICTLIPIFKDVLNILTEEDGVEFTDGLVVPEHSFRRARALLALRDGTESPANIFMKPIGLPAKHRDGSDIMVDVQMRVVRSESVFPSTKNESAIVEVDETNLAVAELVYAVWITYSRSLHSAGSGIPENDSATRARPFTPPSQPAPPMDLPSPPQHANHLTSSDESAKSADSSQLSLLTQQISPSSPGTTEEPLEHPPPHTPYVPHEKKSINDFVILEEMGSGAYGQVKLARYRGAKSRKMVIKYVTKKRILVDTWTRDRRLGTVPLEIHVLDYLRRDDLKHPNIVEMVDFFEDDINYYIEMLPHGIPGMDLFDYIELRADMQELECRNIFRQVVDAIHHLHTKALVVHRDIKDENVVLDGEGRIKLIDFGSATYIKNGPFDVFVGTIDYAAPEVLQGKAYGGKEQDVWALGILLYTIVYKENPFYNIDEILDHPLRVPYIPFSEDCIDLIRKMLDRDVDQRIEITQVKDHHWLCEE